MSWFDAPAPLLPQLLALHGRWQGTRAAVVCDEQVLSWTEFDRRTRRVAHGLLANGIGRGDRIVVLMHNSAEMVEAMFGAIRAGAVVVPLNVAVSDEAVRAMTADAGATAVIASGSHCARIDALRAQLETVRLYLGVDPPSAGWLEWGAFRDRHIELAHDLTLADDDICNIIYSSGTTGLPKGIVHAHRRRLDWTYDLALALRYHSGAITLCTLGLYSNISWVALLCTFIAGGTVVIARSFDARGTLELIQRRRVSHTVLVPVQLQRMFELPGVDDFDFGTLQSVMCCGSPLNEPLKQRVLARMPRAFIELYGLTEGVITTLSPEDASSHPGSVGKPLPGTDLRILDDRDCEAPADVVGEIAGRGRSVMTGYHHRDDANAEATWLDTDGVRWLRTGDLGRLDHDGFLYLVDRKKDLIISGGQNIYPADIEAAMVQHPAVAEVAVIGIASERWGETPLAVVVARGASAPDADELMQWTNARVGKQQRIAAVVFRDELPRNPNGKILKRELRREYRAFLDARP